MVLALAPLAIFAGLILLYMLDHTAAWQRPSIPSLVTADQQRKARGFFGRVWHWVEPKLLYLIPEVGAYKLVKGSLDKLVRYIEHVVASAIAHAAGQFLKPLTREFHDLAVVERDAALALGALAYRTHQAFDWLRHHTVPRLIENAVAPVRSVANTARTLARDAEARLERAETRFTGALAALGIGVWATLDNALVGFAHYVDSLHDEVWHDVVPKLRLLIRQMDAVLDDIYSTGVNSLGGLRVRVKRIENQLADLFDNPLAWIIGLLGTAAGVLALEGILTRIAPNLFCRNTKSVTKKLCGLDEGLLEELLAGTLALLVALNVREIAQAAQATIGELEGVVREMALQ